jgi:hypothetical protein
MISNNCGYVIVAFKTLPYVTGLHYVLTDKGGIGCIDVYNCVGRLSVKYNSVERKHKVVSQKSTRYALNLIGVSMNESHLAKGENETASSKVREVSSMLGQVKGDTFTSVFLRLLQSFSTGKAAASLFKPENTGRVNALLLGTDGLKPYTS